MSRKWPLNWCLSVVAICSVLAASSWTTLQEQVCTSHKALAFRLPFVPGFSPFGLLCDTADFSRAPSIGCNTTNSSSSCHYGRVQRTATALSPLLQDVTQTAYFRYFKVNLFCDCPLWPEDGMCALEACSVCECDEQEVPPAWQQEEAAGCQTLLDTAEQESTVNRSLTQLAEQELRSLPGWKGLDNPWVADADEAVEYSYINLLVNPERYTGYTGEHAHRIWAAIYSQNCFKDVHSEACNEESLLFYRIISGMHASISMHLVKDYLLDEAAHEWGPNWAEFERRFTGAEQCSHVQNLHFVYLFVLRAVAQAKPALQAVQYHTGMPQEDSGTRELMRQVLSDEALTDSCDAPFDVGRMWRGHDGVELKAQLQMHFQNITAILDCVGCEKCKLWGKLQFLGVATALKILFASNNCFERNLSPAELLAALKLERNEVIALVNLLAKLSQSVAAYWHMSVQLTQQSGVQACYDAGAMIL